jgi:hypothetical protein
MPIEQVFSYPSGTVAKGPVPALRVYSSALQSLGITMTILDETFPLPLGRRFWLDRHCRKCSRPDVRRRADGRPRRAIRDRTKLQRDQARRQSACMTGARSIWPSGRSTESDLSAI